MDTPSLLLRPAEPRDVVAIVALIRELAEFEQLSHLVRVTPETLHTHLFGERPVAEAWVAELAGEGGGEVVGFALCFTNFSTFLGQPGLYLEDLYVRLPSVASASDGPCSSGWPGSPSNAAAAASNGACSTGTAMRSASTNVSVPP